MKTFVLLFLTCLLFISTYAAPSTYVCSETTADTFSFLPKSDEFHLDALDAIADIWSVTLDASYDDTIVVNVNGCSNSTNEIHSIMYHSDDGSHGYASFYIDRYINTSTTTTAGSTTGAGRSDSTTSTGHDGTTTGSHDTTTGTHDTTNGGHDDTTTGSHGTTNGGHDDTTTGHSESSTTHNGGTSTTGDNNMGSTTASPTATPAPTTAPTASPSSTTAAQSIATTVASSTTTAQTTTAAQSTTSTQKPATTANGELVSSAHSASPSILLAVFAAIFVVTPKSRLGLLLCVVALVLVMNVSADSSTTSSSASTPFTSTKLNIRVSLPTSIKKICVRGVCYQRGTNGTVIDYVTLFNTRFALIAKGQCSTSTYLRVPAGWKISDNNDLSQLVISLNQWNEYAIALSNNVAYISGAASSVAQANAFTSTPNYFGTGETGYKVSFCSVYILIEQSFALPEPQYALVSPPFINPANIVTFNNYDYAVVGNVNYNNTGGGCDTLSLFLDSSSSGGWELAPEDASSRMVVQSNVGRTWGTDCVVFSTGNSIRSDLSFCSSGDLRNVTFRSGTIFALKSCNKRVLIRRASPLPSPPSSSSAPNTWPTRATITNQYLFGGAYYAALDNVGSANTEAGCQSHYRSVPEGWRIATADELTAFFASVGYGAWPSTYCWTVPSISISPAGTNCSATILLEQVGETLYYATKTCGRILLKRDVDRKTNFTVGMKVLLMSVGSNATTDVAITLAQSVFTATGVPFDWISLIGKNGEPTYPNDLPLYDSNSNPAYYAIVLTDNQLSYNGHSALSDSQQTQLAIYKYTYNVRLVSLASFPNSKLPGVTFSSGGTGAVPGTFLSFDPAYVAHAGDDVAGLNTKADFAIGGVYAVAVTVADNVTPVLKYAYACGKNATTCDPSRPAPPLTPSAPVAAVIVNMTDATEEMHFFFGSSVTYTHGPLLGTLWLNWVTKGLWMGSRRTYLLAQIDDLFLSTEEYDNPTLANRMTALDLDETNNYFKTVLTTVAPAGSNVTCEFGYNGAAVDPKIVRNGANDELYKGVRANIDNFFWESHSYSHLDFTCPESNCTQYGTTTYKQVYDECFLNNNFTRNYLLVGVGSGGVGMGLPTYSPNCMITPKITGLFNGLAIKAMLDNGVQCVVGDNSRKELIPKNLYHGLITTQDFNGYPGLFIIPRFPTEIYYDVATPEVMVAQFNYRYGVNGVIVPQDKNFTLDDILLQEAQRTARALFLFRHDPYMFHQANLVHFPYARHGEDEKQWSLLTLWVASVVDYYVQYMKFPIITMRHQDLWAVYVARMARDACGASSQLVVSNGVATSVKVSATGTCEIAVSGVTSCAGVSGGCRVERYGPDTSVWAQMDGNTKSLSASRQWM